MRLINKLKAVLVIQFIVIAIAFTSCTYAQQAKQPQTKLLSEKEMQAEYKREIKKLKLPPTFVFRQKANVGSISNGSYEEGFGRSNAQAYWIAAWEQEWLEQRNKDSNRAQVALNVLKNEVPKSYYMTKVIDQAGVDFFKKNLKKAELGDPSGFQYDLTVNKVKFFRKFE